jgi:hypothetical protein
MPEILIRSLAKHSELSADLQHRLFEQACATDDEVVLELLARRPDLDPALDARFAGISSARVLTVWVGREGRDAAELSRLALTERRVTVLEVLAGLGEMSDEAYLTLARADNRRIAVVLAANPAAPDAARKLAIATLVSRFHLERPLKLRRETRTVFADLPSDLRSHAVRLADAAERDAAPHRHSLLELADLVVGAPLDDDATERLVSFLCEKVVAAYETHQKTRRWPDGRSCGKVAGLLESLVINAETTRSQRQRIEQALNEVLPVLTYSEKTSVEQALGALTLADDLARLVEQATSGDDELIRAAWQHVKTANNNRARTEVALAAVANPACSPATFEMVVSGVSSWSAGLRSALDMAIQLKDRDKQVVALRYAYVSDRDIDRLTDPLGICLELIQSPQTERLPYLNWLVSHGHGLELPARWLLTDNGRVERLRSFVAPVLDRELAASPARWAAFLALLEGFEGSVAELLETVRLLHRDDSAA